MIIGSTVQTVSMPIIKQKSLVLQSEFAWQRVRGEVHAREYLRSGLSLGHIAQEYVAWDIAEKQSNVGVFSGDPSDALHGWDQEEQIQVGLPGVRPRMDPDMKAKGRPCSQAK